MFNKLLKIFGITFNKPIIAESKTITDDYLLPQSAEQLLNTGLRQALINHIWQHTSLSRENFQKIYLNPIEKYAALVQQFPASENHHHAYLGGLLDHGLELVGHALKLRQSYLLPPGVPPEDQAMQSDAWTAVIAYSGLLHDIGKVAVDIQVQLKDGSDWHPWLGTIKQPYRFRYLSDREYQLHDIAVSLLCQHIIEPEILNWLCQYKELWSNFLHLMAGHYDQAGFLGEIIDKADKISTAKNIGANPEKAIQAPINSLQKKLITGLKYLIKSQFTLNKTPGNGWLTQDGLWLVSKTTADQLRAYLLAQGFDGIPTKNSILFDELQSYHIIQANPVNNRAIWTVLVGDETGKWQQEFTLIKINASLIWSNDEKPALFNGEIQVLQKEDTEEKNQNQLESEAVKTDLNEYTESNEFNLNTFGKTAASQKTTSSSTVFDLSSSNSDTDVILSLFDMDINSAETTAIQLSESGKETREYELANNNKTSTQSITRDHTPPLESSTFTLNLDKPVTKTSLGEEFINWLKNRINHHKLKVNDKDAKVHLIEGKLFIVSPGIFQRFCFEHPELEQVIEDAKKEKWRMIQSSFEKLKLHTKRKDDLNIWQCTVSGPRKKGQIIKGYLLEAKLFFPEFTPNNNPFIELNKED